MLARGLMAATLVLLVNAGAAMAQVAAPRIIKAPNASAIPPDSYPAYIRRTAPTDATIQKIWSEGMQRSQAGTLAQVLLDSIGQRLTGSPNMTRAQDWLVATYTKWGIPVRKEQYGTWNSWARGSAFVELTTPRQRQLDATMLSWSGNTAGKWIDGGVVILKPYATPQEFIAWLPNVKGKIVLTSAPRLSCRSSQQMSEWGTPETLASLGTSQDSLNATFGGLSQRFFDFYDVIKQAGAIAAFETNWSNYPGIERIFGAPRNGALPTIDISCEDYGMLFRLAENNQSPHVRLAVESESFGEKPVFNVVAEIKGSTKANEYVVLSAHFDGWEGHSGATDNATGSITMLEAMRILKAVFPKPTRTILAGHWSGEEQGINGSGAFAEDHPEIAEGMQFAFNQDNGTGRIITMGASIHPENYQRLQDYLSAIPSEITQWIRLFPPGPYNSGSDHVSWLCRGVPAIALNALQWDYSYTTWHTTRDSFDKIVLDDLKNNATLTAMLAYLASEDKNRSSRVLMNPMPNIPGTTRAMTVGNCAKPQRATP